MHTLGDRYVAHGVTLKSCVQVQHLTFGQIFFDQLSLTVNVWYIADFVSAERVHLSVQRRLSLRNSRQTANVTG